MRRIFHPKARVSIAVVLIGLMAPVLGAGKGLDWDNLLKKAPPELLKVAMTKRSALFYTTKEVGSNHKQTAYLGFFISEDGLGLCPLEPLCWEQVPEFILGDDDERRLKTPTVLAIFPEEGLALVKFAHKPKVALTISRELAPLGTWVALLSPSFAPGPMLGPILAHRRSTFHSKLKLQRKSKKNFSIAVASSASQTDAIVRGAPIVDAKGDVVAIYSASIRMPSQTYTIADPTAGLPGRIDEAVKKGSRLKLPIPMKDQPFDPVVYSREYIDGSRAESRGDYAEARKCAKAVVLRFPDSHFARIWEYMMAGTGVQLGAFEPELLVELTEGLKVSEDAPPWERGGYHYRLGEALRVGGKPEEAIPHFQKSDELYPDGMACGTLVTILQRAGRMNEAEHYARRTTTFEPDRIAHWDRLQVILFAQGKFEEADKLQDRVYILEDLY